MPCILVRNSINMEQSSNSTTLIPASIETDVAKKMEVALHPLSFEAKSSEWTPTWSTNHPPFVVLDKLTDLGFSVVAANTVGVTFVWTLQGNMNVQSLRRPIRNDQCFNYAGTMPYNY